MQRSRRAGLDDVYIGTVELAKEFGIHYITALQYIRKKDFPSVKVGNVWKVRRRDAYKYFRDRTDGKARDGKLPGR